MLDNKLILIGYSGHAYVVADIAMENQYKLIGYTEKNIIKHNPFHLEFLGNEQERDFFVKNKNLNYLIGIGDNVIRENIFNLIINNGAKLLTLVSKSASISPSATIGNGTFINRNASVNAFAQIGHNVILNTGCVIEHECEISHSAHIAPGAVCAGNVKVGERTFIGANSFIKQGVKIGDDVIVGAGAIVLTDIPNRKKIVGNPSRFI